MVSLATVQITLTSIKKKKASTKALNQMFSIFIDLTQTRGWIRLDA